MAFNSESEKQLVVWSDMRSSSLAHPLANTLKLHFLEEKSSTCNTLSNNIDILPNKPNTYILNKLINNGFLDIFYYTL